MWDSDCTQLMELGITCWLHTHLSTLLRTLLMMWDSDCTQLMELGITCWTALLLLLFECSLRALKSVSDLCYQCLKCSEKCLRLLLSVSRMLWKVPQTSAISVSNAVKSASDFCYQCLQCSEKCLRLLLSVSWMLWKVRQTYAYQCLEYSEKCVRLMLSMSRILWKVRQTYAINVSNSLKSASDLCYQCLE